MRRGQALGRQFVGIQETGKKKKSTKLAGTHDERRFNSNLGTCITHAEVGVPEVGQGPL